MSVESRSATKPEFSELLEFDVYKRSEANIRRLHGKLPEDLVINLAREVILRVASKERSLECIPQTTTQDDLHALCDALLSEDEKAAARIISEMRSFGVGADDIYRKSLAPAARSLGEMWTRDEVTFSQVTVGTGRIFAIMRSMRHLFEPAIPVQEKTAIFASVPGEDHTLGVHMAADIFRKNGWEIALKTGLDHDQLVAAIEKTPTAIVGLSISGGHSIEALSRLVVALHICCPHAMIVISGSNVEEVEPILSLMGVDAIASSIEEAQEKLDELWATNMAS